MTVGQWLFKKLHYSLGRLWGGGWEVEVEFLEPEREEGVGGLPQKIACGFE
jgi:hypothetical protein